MDLCFLVAGYPGADDLVSAHATRLAARHDVTIALCDDRPLTATAPPGGVRVVALQDALSRRYDVAVAFGWTTTTALFEADAARHAYHVDAFAHEALALSNPLRVAAQISYDLPVDFIAAAPWIARRLAELRPDARCVLAAAGVVRGDPASPDADPVLALNREPLTDVLAGRVVVASVAWPGVEDVIRHGENGFVIEPDDTEGARRLVEHLRAQADERAAVAAAARATSWPDLDGSAAAFEAALTELRETEPPADGRWPRRLMADALSALAQLPGGR